MFAGLLLADDGVEVADEAGYTVTFRAARSCPRRH
jgi:hypothetical protein